jgi:hypothetical protein
MRRITRKYLLRLMLGAAALPLGASSCSANGTKQNPATEQVTAKSDTAIFDEKLAIAERDEYRKLPIGERIVAMGKLFLGTPYVGGTLEANPSREDLVINLRGLDCVTFYENAFALAKTVAFYSVPSFSTYQHHLTKLRYRGGVRDGFASRLHYSSNYFFDNAKRGNMRDVTREVAGALAIKDTRAITFMSEHPNAYKQIKANEAEWAKIKAVEDSINARGGYYYIPKSSVADVEQNIQTGDIIGIVTSINGLDCSHTGIAVKGEDGVVRFMHASSSLGKVVISEGSLSDYIASNSKQTGVVVMRPQEPELLQFKSHQGEQPQSAAPQSAAPHTNGN